MQSITGDDLDIFPTFKIYRWKEWLTLFIACAAIVFAAYSILIFTTQSGETRKAFLECGINQAILIFWSCVPPAWFFVEYYVFWPHADKKKHEKLKIGRELAKPFWAAVLATLLFLIPK